MQNLPPLVTIESIKANHANFVIGVRRQMDGSYTTIPKIDEELTTASLGFRPDLPEPLATVYLTNEDAEQDVDENDRFDNIGYRVCWSFRQESIEPEANEVYVTGIDPIDDQPIRVYWRDEGAQDPSLAPSDWGPRHVGEERLFGITNHRLRSLASCRRALAALVPRVADYRHIAEITCQMLRADTGVPLWRGDLVRIYGKGIYVIRSFEVSFELDPDAHTLDDEHDTAYNATYVRPATYTLERISENF